MKNDFWFGVILTISILLCCFCFESAYVMRGHYAIGGEVFTVALPLGIVFSKIAKMEQKLQRKSKLIEKLQSKLS